MWKDEEVSALLVEYIALYYSPDENSFNVWPACKNDELWGKCAVAVNCYNIGTCNLVRKSGLSLIIDIFIVPVAIMNLLIINLKYTRQYFIVLLLT
jgi:hypothetical protein